jgi:hypothetical protein
MTQPEPSLSRVEQSRIVHHTLVAIPRLRHVVERTPTFLPVKSESGEGQPPVRPSILIHCSVLADLAKAAPEKRTLT